MTSKALATDFDLLEPKIKLISVILLASIKKLKALLSIMYSHFFSSTNHL